MNEEQEAKWRAKEQQRITAKAYPPTQPEGLEEGEPGNFMGSFDRRYKIKG
jgi:hypothetical protein